MWLHLDLIKEVHTFCRDLFPVVEYAYTTIPTYPSGQIGFVICCNDAGHAVREPARRWTEEEEDRLCSYYNAEVHAAAFVAPQFVKRRLRA